MSDAINPVASSLSNVARGRPKLEQGRLYSIDGETVRFDGAMEGGELQFLVLRTRLLIRTDAADTHSPLPRLDWLAAMIAAGRLKPYSAKHEIGPQPRRHMMDETDARELDPGSVIRFEVMRRVDTQTCTPTDRDIDQVVREVLAEHPKEAGAFRERPTAKTVRVWLRTRGSFQDRAWIDCVSTKSRGRRKARLNPWVREQVVRWALWFWADKLASKKDAYDQLCDSISAENGHRQVLGIGGQIDLPSRSTFIAYISELETYDTLAAKYGEVFARARCKSMGRAIRGDSILSIVQIDHTSLDLIVIDHETAAVLGRPTLTTLIDTYSRCILGSYLSFEGPSLGATMQALKRCLTPKLGCVGSERWAILQDIFGKPSELVTDNGLEFVGSSLQDALADMGITVTAVKVKSPDHKPFVERLFGTINSQLIHKAPGTRLNRQKRDERGDDFESDPRISLSDLDDLIAKLICSYHISGHSELNDQPPALLWQNEAIRSGIPVMFELDRVDRLLAMARERTLANDGVELFGLQFNDRATTNAIFDLERRSLAKTKRASLKVKIKFNPHDLGRIWIYSPAAEEYYELPCVEPGYADGLTLHQHVTIRRHLRREGHRFSTQSERLAARQNLRRSIESLDPSALNKTRRNAARLASKPPVAAKLEALGARSVTGIPLLPSEPLQGRRNDGGVLPKATPRGAVKAQKTRAATAARSLRQSIIDHEPPRGIEPSADRFSQDWRDEDWRSY